MKIVQLFKPLIATSILMVLISACTRKIDCTAPRPAEIEFLHPLDFRLESFPVGDEKFVSINCTNQIQKTAEAIIKNENVDRSSETYQTALREAKVFNTFNKTISDLMNSKDVGAEDKIRRKAVYLSEAFLEYKKVNPATHDFCHRNLEVESFKCRTLPTKDEMTKCIVVNTQNILKKVTSYRLNQFRKLK